MASLCLEIWPTASRYDIDDDVPVRVLLFNLGDEPVTVNARFAIGSPSGPGELCFSVTDPAGQSLPFGARVNIGDAGPDDFATVQPHACVGRLVDLVDYFALDEPGDYRVTASYRSRSSAETPPYAWTGTLDSEAMSIELR